MTNRRNYLVPIIAMMFMLGTVAGVAWAATDSGADSFQIVSYPDTTSIGGDSVNLSIQVLDASGNVNIDSNGQAGDVLFSVSSSIGTVLVPAGAPGAQVAAGPGNGNFATISGNNYAPGAGNALFNIAYGGVSGTDTLTVKMYNSIINNAGAVVASSQIGAAQTVSVAVSEGAGITAIANVAMTNNLDVGDADTDATYVDQEETYAGMTGAFQVAVNAGGSGTVTVEFVGIAQRDRFGNSASGTTITADCTVSNGQGTFTAVFEKAGYYEIRASAESGTVTYTKVVAPGAATDILGGAYALRVRPNQPVALKTSIPLNVLDNSTVGTIGGTPITVTRIDEYGNDTGIADPTIADPLAAGALAPADNISLAQGGTGTVVLPAAFPFGAAGDDAVTSGDITNPADAGNIRGGATAGNVTVKATATGYTDSEGESLIVCNDLTAAEAGGGGAIAIDAALRQAEIDDGAGAALAGGAVTFGVGQQMKVINISAGTDANGTVKLSAGQPVSLILGGNTLTSSLVATGIVAGGGTGTDTEGVEDELFSATFTLPTTAVNAARGILEVSNGRFASFVLGNAGAEYAITTNAAAGAKVTPLTPNGFELTSFNAGFRGRSFDFPNTGQGGFFSVEDTYGNNVTNAVSGFTGTLASSNLSGGNNSTIDLGTDTAGNPNDDARLTWPTSFNGDDTLTLTPISLSGIPAIDLPVTNVGVNAIQTITVTPALTETLANAIIPLEIRTTDLRGRTSSAALENNLIISIESTDTLARLVEADGATGIANGAIIDTRGPTGVSGTDWDPANGGTFGDDTDGRLMIGIDSGAQQGTLKIKVQTVDGSLVAESEEITIATNADLAPTNVVGGMDSTDPADVTATANDTVDLYVFTDIDGFTPTSCWVTLSIEGTNFYWVYDEANTAWVRFNFVPEGHADFNASFPTLADAINDYAFTATGANQQVGDDLPMTGMSGLVFKITVWYFDAAGALQSFDYLVTVS